MKTPVLCVQKDISSKRTVRNTYYCTVELMIS